ncbi:MAG: hemolysin III family protein [Dysosmobacter welbionis]
MLLSVYGGTVCRQRHLSLLSRHCRQRRVKRVLRKMDHSMIYVLIAGSYTPFCVVLLPQPREHNSA